MKLKSHSVSRGPNDVMSVKATWNDRFRKPASVELVLTMNSDASGLDNTLASGDAKDVAGAIFGIAEIAWNMGWRPEGFVNAVMGVVAAHKVPPK